MNFSFPYKDFSITFPHYYYKCYDLHAFKLYVVNSYFILNDEIYCDLTLKHNAEDFDEISKKEFDDKYELYKKILLLK